MFASECFSDSKTVFFITRNNLKIGILLVLFYLQPLKYQVVYEKKFRKKVIDHYVFYKCSSINFVLKPRFAKIPILEDNLLIFKIIWKPLHLKTIFKLRYLSKYLNQNKTYTEKILGNIGINNFCMKLSVGHLIG